MNLSVHSLCFSYQTAPLLRDLDFSLDTGSFVCVLGKNGAGKSTLFQCILNLQKNYTGMISLDGQNVKALKEKSWQNLLPIFPSCISRAFLFPYLIRSSWELLPVFLPFPHQRRRKKKLPWRRFALWVWKNTLPALFPI